MHFHKIVGVALATLLLSDARAATIEMTVNGLVCGFCAQGIEKTLRKNAATEDVLVGLVAAVPQLVWLSEHKALVFGVAAGLLLVSGGLLWNARRLPCPIDPTAARTCATLRKVSGWLYGVAAIAYLIGVTFAFVLPAVT